MAAMRWATLPRSPICSARCSLSAWERRSASLARASSRSFSAACAAWSCSSASRRTTSASCAEEDLQPAIEQLVQGHQRFRERGAVGSSLDQGRNAGAVEGAHREQDERRAGDGRRGVLLVVRLQPGQLALSEPRQQRIDVALGISADVRHDPGGHLRQLTRPGHHQPVAVRLQMRGRLLQRQRERSRHPFLSPM
jgi:hypothetical protein